MRKLDFSGEHGAKRYAIMMDGLMGTARGFKAPVETRTFGRILDKMEAIGVEGARTSASSFSLPESAAVTDVELKESEYTLVKETLEQVPWRPAGVRDATEMMEWFNEVPTVKDEEKDK
jgi:hypothetical protein